VKEFLLFLTGEDLKVDIQHHAIENTQLLPDKYSLMLFLESVRCHRGSTLMMVIMVMMMSQTVA